MMKVWKVNSSGNEVEQRYYSQGGRIGRNWGLIGFNRLEKGIWNNSLVFGLFEDREREQKQILKERE